MSALRLASADLVTRLGEMEERPWAEWKHSKPMTRPQLAAALRPFGIIPRTVRTPRGPAWVRLYLDPREARMVSTPKFEPQAY
jgi:hypothetical protein